MQYRILCEEIVMIALKTTYVGERRSYEQEAVLINYDDIYIYLL